MAIDTVQGVALCIGASIEFLLGRKTRAPRWMQMAGMEWIFRLLSEPRRLWRRYLFNGPRILSIVTRWQP
jgi:N-acetylglucosaminyldiphosphoundecaprenol N-acetyl-beta-D-mannosaminyltransferase